jgi:hypothetical protein
MKVAASQLTEWPLFAALVSHVFGLFVRRSLPLAMM